MHRLDAHRIRLLDPFSWRHMLPEDQEDRAVGRGYPTPSRGVCALISHSLRIPYKTSPAQAGAILKARPGRIAALPAPRGGQFQDLIKPSTAFTTIDCAREQGCPRK